MESNSSKIMVSIWVMVILAFIFMILRFICKRRYHQQPVSLDEAVLFLSWVLALLYVIFITIAVQHGLGKRVKDVSPTDLTLVMKNVVIGDIFIILAIPISKTSFGLTLLRITVKRFHKWVIWVTLISTNIVMWLCAALSFFQCIPVSKGWDRTVEGRCWDSRVVVYYSVFAGLYSVLTDVLLSTFPWVIIRKLQIHRKEKIGIIVSMSLGILAAISAAVKTSTLVRAAKWTDVTFDMADLLIWATVETAITIIVSSIPYLRVLARDISLHITSNRNGKSSRSIQLKDLESSRHTTWHDTKRDGRDRSSEKSILGDSEVAVDTLVHPKEITKVTEFVVIESQDIAAEALEAV